MALSSSYTYKICWCVYVHYDSKKHVYRNSCFFKLQMRKDSVELFLFTNVILKYPIRFLRFCLFRTVHKRVGITGIIFLSFFTPFFINPEHCPVEPHYLFLKNMLKCPWKNIYQISRLWSNYCPKATRPTL